LRISTTLLLTATSVLINLLAGCQDSPQSAEDITATRSDASTLFDLQSTGTITGTVVWDGPRPKVSAFVAPVSPQWDPKGQDFLSWPNPNVPVIDDKSSGVKDAVVFLRNVDPRRARPWNHAPVRVEQIDYRIQIRQGELESRCGFVRCGDEIEMISRQSVFHSMHAGGANFFTLAFPDRDKPLSRRLERPGLTELSSAAGCYWMRGYLFVADHPYYCRTDCEGRFHLPQVPAGQYELVCWHPNWRERGHDRDPESSLVCRLYFQPPAKLVRMMKIGAGKTENISFTLTADAFSAR